MGAPYAHRPTEDFDVPHATFNALTSRSSAASTSSAWKQSANGSSTSTVPPSSSATLTNYIAGSLFGAGGFNPPLHPQLRRARLAGGAVRPDMSDWTGRASRGRELGLAII